ncbi:hypothetical protein TWF694_006399 [Orbilia ellipsospora]|uniref:Clr5 domain-containing protein n=1 Tax=Orbilia ellipsospora TaxID=2528407 RepID=A0AAV9XKE8_9PEZI
MNRISAHSPSVPYKFVQSPKPTAPRKYTTDYDWEKHKDFILNLDSSGFSQPSIRRELEKVHNLIVSNRQIKHRLTKWRQICLDTPPRKSRVNIYPDIMIASWRHNSIQASNNPDCYKTGDLEVVETSNQLPPLEKTEPSKPEIAIDTLYFQTISSRAKLGGTKPILDRKPNITTRPSLPFEDSFLQNYLTGPDTSRSQSMRMGAIFEPDNLTLQLLDDSLKLSATIQIPDSGSQPRIIPDRFKLDWLSTPQVQLNSSEIISNTLENEFPLLGDFQSNSDFNQIFTTTTIYPDSWKHERLAALLVTLSQIIRRNNICATIATGTLLEGFESVTQKTELPLISIGPGTTSLFKILEEHTPIIIRAQNIINLNSRFCTFYPEYLEPSAPFISNDFLPKALVAAASSFRRAHPRHERKRRRIRVFMRELHEQELGMVWEYYHQRQNFGEDADTSNYPRNDTVDIRLHTWGESISTFENAPGAHQNLGQEIRVGEQTQSSINTPKPGPYDRNFETEQSQAIVEIDSPRDRPCEADTVEVVQLRSNIPESTAVDMADGKLQTFMADMCSLADPVAYFTTLRDTPSPNLTLRTIT